MSVETSSDLPVKTLPKITVFGVGGAGLNAVNNMILSQLESVKFVCANTDCQSLANSLAETKIQLGAKCTKGLGAGSNPEIGRQSAEEAMDVIKRELADTDMLFIAAGMGGGTGTGASPVIAKVARDMGILTIAIVIKPFEFEGKRRMETANKGVAELEKLVDTIIIIENQKLATLNNISMSENFAVADGILRHAVYCVVDILVKPGFINRDFADIKTILTNMGRAVIGYGEDIDPRIATDAAIHNPILENSSIVGAKNILVNITGNRNLKPSDIQNIIDKISAEAGIEPNIIFGIVFDEALGENVRVSIIAAGVEQAEKKNTENLIEEKRDEVLKKVRANTNEEVVEDRHEAVEYRRSNVVDFDRHEVVDETPIANPVFAKRIDEDDLEGECEVMPALEDVDTFEATDRIVRNRDNGNYIEKKKKVNKAKEVADKAKSKAKVAPVENGLYDNQNTKPQKGSLFSRLLNSIGPGPYIADDVESVFSDEDNQEDDNDIYKTPAINRKIA